MPRYGHRSEPHTHAGGRDANDRVRRLDDPRCLALLDSHIARAVHHCSTHNGLLALMSCTRGRLPGDQAIDPASSCARNGQTEQCQRGSCAACALAWLVRRSGRRRRAAASAWMPRSRSSNGPNQQGNPDDVPPGPMRGLSLVHASGIPRAGSIPHRRSQFASEVLSCAYVHAVRSRRDDGRGGCDGHAGVVGFARRRLADANPSTTPDGNTDRRWCHCCRRRRPVRCLIPAPLIFAQALATSAERDGLPCAPMRVGAAQPDALVQVRGSGCPGPGQ